MTGNKLDKSVVFTAFVCAAAVFACGFAFCLALLSSGASCYLRVHNFWYSTRGYFWFTELRDFWIEHLSELIAVIGATVFAVAVLPFLFGCKNSGCCHCKKAKSSACGNNSCDSKTDSPLYVNENEVAEVLSSCRRNPEAASWEKLNTLPADVLAGYLKNEYPQVVALTLSRLTPQKSAAVLSLFQADFAAEIVNKMLNSRPVDNELVGTLGKNIAANIENYQKHCTADKVSAIWKYLNSKSETEILASLAKYAPDTAEVLQNYSICFEDLISIPAEQLGQVLATIGEPKLVIALRGASDKLRNHFYTAMPERQSKVIIEALSRLGPIKLRDIEKAQKDIVIACKRIFDATFRGEING